MRCPVCRKHVHLPELLAAAPDEPDLGATPTPVAAGFTWAGNTYSPDPTPADPTPAHNPTAPESTQETTPESEAEPEQESTPDSEPEPEHDYVPRPDWAPAPDTWEAPVQDSVPMDADRIQKVEWTQESAEPVTFNEELEEESDPDDPDQDPRGPDPGIRRKRRKRRFGLFGETPDWETSAPRRRGRDTTGKRIIAAGVGIAALGAIVAAAIMFSSSGRTGGEAKREPAPLPPIILPTDSQVTLSNEEAMEKLREALQIRPRETVASIKPAVTAFLNAANWEERGRRVRDPERVLPLMEAFYRTNPDGPIPFIRVGDEEDRVDYRGNLLVLRVLLKDYSTKQVAIEYTGSDFLIDWESFVGYGEMSPRDLREQRPAEPVLVRASLAPAVPPYFNYAFTDEENLECYVLTFPDDSYLFGYTMKIGSLANRLRELRGDSPSVMVVLKIRYPENAAVGDQVWIDDVAAEGWILHEETRTTEP